MRVAFITSEYPPDNPGGAGISSKLIVEGLRDRGVDVEVFALVGERRERFRSNSGLWHLPDGEEYPFPKAIGENVSSYLHLPKLNSYDIIHVYNVRHLPACVLRSSAPVVATMNNHLWICIDPAQHLHDGLPECTIRHNLKYARSEGYSRLQAPGRVGIEYLGKFLSQTANAFTVQTTGMREVMTKCGYNSSTISVVGNILDSRFEIESDNQKKIIFVGRLRENKAPDMVIRSYAELSPRLKEEWDLEIYGNGPMKEQLKDLIDQKGLESVTLGYSPYRELPEVYRDAGVLVHSSQYTEPFSRTWLEAMASGTPIVCSENPSSRDILDDVAQFYEPFDRTSLTEILSAVLSDLSLRDEMQSAGQNLVNEYRPGVITSQYTEIYDMLL